VFRNRRRHWILFSQSRSARIFPGSNGRDFRCRRLPQPAALSSESRDGSRPDRILDAFDGYCGVTRYIIEHHAEPAFSGLFAINYYIGPKPVRAGQVEMFQGANGLNVYRNPNPRPRVWAVHEAFQIPGPKAVNAALNSPDFDPGRQTFLLTAAPHLETCGRPDQVRLLERAPNRVVIEADLGCRGMVIAGETDGPGWQATVDGQTVRIYEAYSALRGVVVDPGRHRVEMRYRPKSVFVGAILTALGIAGAVVFYALAI
jgi:hypothetical protein